MFFVFLFYHWVDNYMYLILSYSWSSISAQALPNSKHVEEERQLVRQMPCRLCKTGFGIYIFENSKIK